MDKLIATQQNFGDPLRGFSNVGLNGLAGSESVSTFELVISATLALLTVSAVLVFIFFLITGAISYITSGGDKGKTEEARRKITTGLVGLTIVISAIFIIDLIGFFLDVNLLDVGGWVTNFSTLIN